MTKADHRREMHVNEGLSRALSGTDDAGRTTKSDAARELLRDDLRRIPEDATPEQMLELRERALNKFHHAAGIVQRGRRA